MRVLLSTIGSRGDVQPLVALASQLRALGQEVRLCVPPDFRAWLEGLGLPVVTIGPEVRGTGKAAPAGAPPTAEQRRAMVEATVATQFETLTAAAQDCDLIVGATALQIAAPSVAEKLAVPYVFAAYCPAVLPSPRHAPPVLAMLGDAPAVDADDYSDLWERDGRRWNEQWRGVLNDQRARLDLVPVADVRSHVLTNRPWLAADPVLAPWPGTDDKTVLQTGAWVLPDTHPLPAEVEAFLDAGEPPVYFGFGSIRAPQGLAEAMVTAARACGRRAIVSRGWADLAPRDDAADRLFIGEVDHQLLFTRVAAVVHHGGAGTTTTAARAGAPQVVIPQHYDQHYWARRVRELGIGAAHAPAAPSAESLTAALRLALAADVAARARSLAGEMRDDAALTAARLLLSGSPWKSPIR